MILTTHAVVGAAAALAVSHNPLLAFFAACVSHFLLDAIPHWDYDIKSLVRNPTDSIQYRIKPGKPFLRDLALAGLDGTAGVASAVILGFFFFSGQVEVALLGAIGGVLPDFLQLVHWVFPRAPLSGLQRFHRWIQSHASLKKMPILGVAAQLGIIILSVSLLLGGA